MLKALFYPDVNFDSLFLPYIYKEIYFDGIYVDVLNQKKDLTIIDVGANCGVVTNYMLPYAKKIYALEPSTEHFEALKKNKEFNKWDNVEVFKLAMADKNGEMALNLNTNNRTCHSLALDYKQGSEMVKTIRFDTFLKENKIDKVDFCKFDVEGFEDAILRSEGFTKIAEKVKAIEVEFHLPTWQGLVRHMEGLGYQERRFDCSAIVVLFIR